MKGEDEGEGAQGKPAKEAGQGSRKRNQPRKQAKKKQEKDKRII